MHQFNPVTFLCLSQARTLISKVIYLGLFRVWMVSSESSCSFCSYWQNCWPSLFILAELLTFTVYTGRIVDLYCLYWQNCWPSLFILAELLTFTVYTGRIVDLHCLNYLFINGFQVYILHIHCVIPLLLSVTFSFLSSKLFFVDLSLS